MMKVAGDHHLLLVLFSIAAALVPPCCSFFFYQPMSRSQSLEECLTMKRNQAPYYPSYCDEVIEESGVGMDGETTTPPPNPMQTIGWGWKQWGSWVENACPQACGRGCRVRRRSCAGSFEQTCKGRGVAYQFENCDALPSGGDFQTSQATGTDTTHEDGHSANDLTKGGGMTSNSGGRRAVRRRIRQKTVASK